MLAFAFSRIGWIRTVDFLLWKWTRYLCTGLIDDIARYLSLILRNTYLAIFTIELAAKVFENGLKMKQIFNPTDDLYENLHSSCD